MTLLDWACVAIIASAIVFIAPGIWALWIALKLHRYRK